MTPLAVYGARQHNLKNVTCNIPRGELVVVTGPSGSGKSSLAFGTIHAEAQRRYAEVLPRAARRHLEHLPRPDVDDITGLCPVVAMKQGAVSRSSRATLGTFSETADYLRRLFAHGATAYCPVGHHPIVKQSAAQIVQTLLREPTGTKMSIMAPLLRQASPQEIETSVTSLMALGFARVVLNGDTLLLGEVNARQLPEHSRLDLVIDRIVLRDGIETRLADSVELALREGARVVLVDYMDGRPVREFSDKLVCRTHDCTLPEPTPELFSFNHSAGACAACAGLGARARLEMGLAVPNPELSLRQGAVAVFGSPGSVAYATLVNEFVKQTGLDPDVPWSRLEVSASVVEALHDVVFDQDSDDPNEGVGLTGKLSRAELDSFFQWVPCSVCGGTRLGPHAAHFALLELTLPEWARLPLSKVVGLVRDQTKLPGLLQPVWLAIQIRLECLLRLSLGYLTLDTPLQQLSSGEMQRANLAQHINGGLSGVMYVLDEPTASLSETDARCVIDELERLVAEGNSLLVVEHNPEVWKVASHIIDMGPSAGALGGFIVATGTADDLGSNPKSVTGPYLVGHKRLEKPNADASPVTSNLRFEHLRQGNLKGISVEIPLGRVSVVTGPSGSGKTTLVMRAILPALRAQTRAQAKSHRHKIANLTPERVITLDQSPIGRSFRSTPATYTGLLTPLRELFASLPEARTRGFKAARFSYNAKGGRCEMCKGEGVLRLDVELISEVGTTCPECLGARFNRETLAPKFRGLSIADVLRLTVDQALPLFGNMPKLAAVLRELSRLGLGYVVLGQPAPTLSGGEAQRIRLATELSKTSTGAAIYLLDEPTNGLHPVDVQQVLDALFALSAAGNTVVMVEHSAAIVALADWVIDLGPGAGPDGGNVVYSGPANARSNNYVDPR